MTDTTDIVFFQHTVSMAIPHGFHAIDTPSDPHALAPIPFRLSDDDRILVCDDAPRTLIAAHTTSRPWDGCDAAERLHRLHAAFARALPLLDHIVLSKRAWGEGEEAGMLAATFATGNNDWHAVCATLPTHGRESLLFMVCPLERAAQTLPRFTAAINSLRPHTHEQP